MFSLQAAKSLCLSSFLHPPKSQTVFLFGSWSDWFQIRYEPTISPLCGDIPASQWFQVHRVCCASVPQVPSASLVFFQTCVHKVTDIHDNGKKKVYDKNKLASGHSVVSTFSVCFSLSFQRYSYTIVTWLHKLSLSSLLAVCLSYSTFSLQTSSSLDFSIIFFPRLFNFLSNIIFQTLFCC